MDPTYDSLNPIDQLAEEFVDRYRRGQRPTWQEYAERYPELADEIGDLFPTLLVMEKLRPNLGDTLDGLGNQQQTGRETIPQFGDFHVLQEVGRGGMGIVYEAEQVSLGRRVALKVLPKHLLQDKRHKKRFEREARAAARLHHTNIVPVFGVGEQDGLLYYVMQFIQGLPLDQVLVELRRQLKSPSADARSDRLREPLAVSLAQIDQPVDEAIAQEGWRRVDVSAARVAESLVTGAFRQPDLKSAHESEVNLPITQMLETSPAGECVGNPGDTVSCRLSETQVGSQTVHLRKCQRSGSSAHSGPTAFWQSIARIGEQIAEALQHAHEQGIVHRDIKPGNLLLDTHGTVWVTDFGLAKADDQQNLTQTGDVLGTLRYMAPEQFQGRGDAQSDVYALGITLYELLALRPAFANAKRGELVHQILHEPVTPLRSVEPTIPRDLATIVHKAIERDPRHRYATAQAMADDLHRFVTDEPILARHLSLSARLRRWCRKNPAVAGLAGVLATLLTFVAVGSSLAAARFEKLATANAQLVVQANQEKSQAQAAKDIALVAQRQAESAAEREKRLREEAERQKDRANSNFTRARRAVDTYLSHVTDNELLSVPGLQTLRHDLLTAALRFYAEFSEESSDDPQIQIELAAGRFRLSRIQSELGLPETTETLRKAIPMLESLHEQRLGGNETAVMLAEAYLYDKRYDEAIVTCNTILESDPKSVAARTTLANTYNALAIGDDIEKAPAKVLELHQQALAIRQQLVAEYPDDPEHNASLASTFNNIGVLLHQRGKLHDALKMFQLGLPYNEKACRMVPRSILWGRWLITKYKNIGSVQRSLGDDQAALAAYTAAAEQWRRLVLQNPVMTSLRNDYYQALQTLASQQRRMGQAVDASRTMRDAREVLEEMRLRIDTPQQWFELATVYASLAFPGETEAGTEGLDAESQDERQRNVQRTLDALQHAVDAGWVDTKAIETHAAFAPLLENEAFQELVRVTIPLKQPELAAKAGSQIEPDKLADQQRAAEILSQRIAAAPEQTDHRRSLATTQHSIGVIQTTLKQYDEAEQSFNDALAIRDQVLANSPQDPLAALEMIGTRIALGQLHWEKARFPDGHRTWQQCLNELRTLAEANRDHDALQQRIAAEERIICNGYGRFGLWPLAVDYVRRRVEYRSVSGGLQDAEFAAFLLLDESSDVGQQYLKMLADAVALGDDPYKSKITNLLQTAAMARSNPFAEDDLVLRAREVLASKKGPWPALVLATALYRAGELEEAQRIIGPIDKIASHLFGRPQASYVKAIISSAVGDRVRALEHLNRGESLYRQVCLESLAHTAIDSLGLPHENWHHLIQIQVQRRTAIQLIYDGDRPKDPWLHLIHARGYHLIGERELAEQELELARAAAEEDPEAKLEHAMLVLRWFGEDRGSEAFETAIAPGADDAGLRIARGRWYAETGKREEADRDFAAAASLCSNELDRFLHAGWWVAGPYPPELDRTCPPEFDPDPAVPVRLFDPTTGVPGELTPWHSVSTRETEPGARDGAVFMPDLPDRVDDASYYALTYVYSPNQRSVSLFTDRRWPIRVWLNGQLMSPPLPDRIEWINWQRVPMMLVPGRNTILVKTSSNRFAAWLDDNPNSQAWDQFKFGSYRRSLEDYSQLLTTSTSLWHLRHAVQVARMIGDRERYSDFLDQLPFARDSGADMRQSILDTQLFIGWDLGPKNQERLRRVLRTWYEQDRTAEPGWSHEAIAKAHYYLGEYEKAIAIHDEHAGKDSWSIAAMTHHRTEDHEAARKWLALIRAALEQDQNRFLGDGGMGFASFFPHYREAVELIEGDAESLDRQLEQFIAEREVIWDQRDPLVAAFDMGVLNAPGNPNAYLARARGFAARGMLDEAATDVDRAVSLAPRDTTIATEQARFLVRRGDVEKGSAAYAQAFGMPANHPVGMLAEDLERGRTQRVWNFALGDKPWSFHEQVEIAASAGVLTLRTTGTDPQVLFNTWAPAGKKWLTICARVPQPIPNFELYWSTLKSPNLSADKVTRFSVNASDGEFRRYHVIFEPDSELKSLRLDPGWNPGVSLEIAWVTLRDYSADEFKRIAESDAATPLDLGVLWYQAGQPAAAKDALARFEQQGSDSSEAWLIASDLWFSLGKFERATAACQRSLSMGIAPQKQLADAKFRLARLKILAEEYPEAIRLLTEVIELTRQVGLGMDRVWPERARCVAWLLSGELDRYRQRCAELLEEYEHGEDPLGLVTTVFCCSLHPQAVDDWSRVIAAAERMVARYPAADWSGVHLFLTLCQAGQVEEAYRRVPDIESKANSWRWGIAIGEALRGNHQRAAEVLDAFEQQCRTALGFDRAVSQSVIEYVRTLIADSKRR